MATVLLVRHGESLSNIGMATWVSKEISLTGKGFKQAEEVAQQLKAARTRPDLIITSPYLRTKQTAEPTIRAFPDTPVEVWAVQEFTYLSYWNDEITTIEDRKPLVDAYWETCNPSYLDGPGAESFEHFINRVREVRRLLKSRSLEKIVVFSHEQFISALMWLAQHDRENVTPEMMREFHEYLKENRIPNAAIRRVRFRSRAENRSQMAVKSQTSAKKAEKPLPELAVAVARSDIGLPAVPVTPILQTPRSSNARTSPQRTVVNYTPPLACQMGRSDGRGSSESNAFKATYLRAVRRLVKKLRTR